jgi:hypothetical protein
MQNDYIAKVTVADECGSRPFKLSGPLNAATDIEAKAKASAWYENSRPFLYEPIELLLRQGDREVQRWNFA